MACRNSINILRTFRKFWIVWKFKERYSEALEDSVRSTSFVTNVKLVDFLQVVGNQKKCFGHSGRSTGFVTSFETILKLVDFFTSCGQSEKMFRTLRKGHRLCNLIWNYSEACSIFYKLWAVQLENMVEHSVWSTGFVNSFKTILNLVDFFTRCGQSEKMFGTLWKVQRLCNFIWNYSESCRIFTSCWQSEKIFRRFLKIHRLWGFFETILKLVEVVTSCGQSEKMSRTFRKVYRVCKLIEKRKKYIAWARDWTRASWVTVHYAYLKATVTYYVSQK